MKKKERARVMVLLKEADAAPLFHRYCCMQALRVVQQSMATNGDDPVAIGLLAAIWLRLGASRRARGLLQSRIVQRSKIPHPQY